MSNEISVGIEAIYSARHLCETADNELSITISKLDKTLSTVSAKWSDRKGREFLGIVKDCEKVLKKPLDELKRCQTYLQELAYAIAEYESVDLSGGRNRQGDQASFGSGSHSGGDSDGTESAQGNGSDENGQAVSNDMSHSGSVDVDGCNNALERDGLSVRMVDISSVEVDGVNEPEFWSHHGESEEGWRERMSEYSSMMNDYANGMSIDECYDRYPNTAGVAFGRDPIRITNGVNGNLVASGGRHRIAMAQRLGIRYLPATVY